MRDRDHIAPAARQTFPIHLQRHVSCCKTQLFAHRLSLKHAFCATRPPKRESPSSENEAPARDIPQKLKVEEVETKLSCETSLKLQAEDVERNNSCEASLQN